MLEFCSTTGGIGGKCYLSREIAARRSLSDERHSSAFSSRALTEERSSTGLKAFLMVSVNLFSIVMS